MGDIDPRMYMRELYDMRDLQVAMDTLAANLAIAGFGCEAYALGAAHPAWFPGCGWAVKPTWVLDMYPQERREEAGDQ